jgi:MFS family permease
MFLVGILPALLLLYVRRWVEEPAVWTTANRDRRDAQQRVQMGSGSSHDKQLAQFTISEILSDAELRRRVGLLLIMSVTTVVGWWSASTWIPEFASQLSTHSASQGQLASSTIGMMFGLGSVAGILTLGFFADAVGRNPTIWFYYLGALVVSLCYFLFVRERTALLVMAAANGFFSSGQFAWMTIYLPELFPTRVRGTAMSLVFDTSRSIAGLGPLLAGWLVMLFGGIGNAAAAMSLIYIVGLIATPFAGQETMRTPLPV